MKCGFGLSTLFLMLALVSSCGCIGGHLASVPAGPAKTTVSGVTIEFAPAISADGIESSGGERSATVLCGSTKVEIEDMNLTVNGRSYGTLKKGDRVFLDKDTVRVNDEVRAAKEK